jgi:hypothetical protein
MRQDLTPLQALAEIRHLLDELLQGRPLDAEHVADLTRTIERGLQGERPLRKKEPKVYKILRGRVGDVLVEGVRGRPIPSTGTYRCQKSIYDALAEVMAGADEFLDLYEVTDRVGQRLGTKAGAFQLRLALRYWLQHEPPLISRVRARYRSTAKGSFRKAADKAWKSLEILS